jgi:hypothetical protein
MAWSGGWRRGERMKFNRAEVNVLPSTQFRDAMCNFLAGENVWTTTATKSGETYGRIGYCILRVVANRWIFAAFALFALFVVQIT